MQSKKLEDVDLKAIVFVEYWVSSVVFWSAC